MGAWSAASAPPDRRDAVTVPGPSPALSASDVVAAQLVALQAEPQDGDGPGAGIRTAFSFASPGNQAAIGPLDRFAELLRNPLYVGLLEHRVAQLGPLQERGDDAQQEVLVLTRDDRTEGFTWVLARRWSPPHEGCWLTDGVLRHPERGGRT